MMSGAVWVRDRLQAAGCQVEVADARKVKAVAPLACKTDKVDARVLAELCRRDLVPAVWVPSFSNCALRERLNRRAHLIRLRTAAKNRGFGALSQWGMRIPLRVIRAGDAMALLERRGLPEVWRRSVAEALAVIDILDARIAPLEAELRPLARADQRVQLLTTTPGVGEHLALMIAAEVGDVARFPSPRKLIGFAGLAPRSNSRGRARAPGRSPRPARVHCGGRRSRPPSVRGGRRTPGTACISMSNGRTGKSTRPRARSPARS
jgi:transposase